MKPVNNSAPDLVSIDDLHASIVKLAAHINAETYELLVLPAPGWTGCTGLRLQCQRHD